MACPICTQSGANCDCTDLEIEQSIFIAELEDLQGIKEEKNKELLELLHKSYARELEYVEMILSICPFAVPELREKLKVLHEGLSNVVKSK